MIGSSSSLIKPKSQTRRTRPRRAATARLGPYATPGAHSYPVKTSTTETGKAFDLDHLLLSAKDKGAIPVGVYEKTRGDGIVMEKLGPDTLWSSCSRLARGSASHRYQ